MSSGSQAEQVAADYLELQGYEVLKRNWRTRHCEIDIVTKKHKVIYFFEVKYRRNVAQGSGLDYITPRKLKQMRFAAEMWVHDYGWHGDYHVGAIEVGGAEFAVTGFIESITWP